MPRAQAAAITMAIVTSAPASRPGSFLRAAPLVNSSTAATTKTSTMLCLTNAAIAPAAPAARLSRNPLTWWRLAAAATYARIPATTNGSPSSSPLTTVPPNNGVATHTAAVPAVSRGADRRSGAAIRPSTPDRITVRTAASVPISRSGTAPPSASAASKIAISTGGRSTQKSPYRLLPSAHCPPTMR